MIHSTSLIALIALVLALAVTPGPARAAAPDDAATRGSLVGMWRGVLISPGGELPFRISIAPPGTTPPAVVHNGREQAPFTSVSVEGRSVVIEMAVFDSRIEAELNDAGDIMAGTWSKPGANGLTMMPFTAFKGRTNRFDYDEAVKGDPRAIELVPTVKGIWSMQFTDDDGTWKARGEFAKLGQRVTGTIMTPLGDYRFLEGMYQFARMRLSAFDGGHAFLIEATAQPDGTLIGDFWSGDRYHATWTAERISAEDRGRLPNPWTMVTATDSDRRFRFSFPDADGTTVSSSDERFEGKVVVVMLFGTWCPNCHDAAPLLQRLYETYKEKGLEIVGLAFEHTDDSERSMRQLRRFAEHFELEFPLLLAGISDKAQAAESVPDLSEVIAYPTTVFIDRNGTIQAIHTGFTGPGTGNRFTRLERDFNRTISILINTPVGQTPPTQQ